MYFRSKVVDGFRLFFEASIWNRDPALVRLVTLDLQHATGFLPSTIKAELALDTEIHVRKADAEFVGRYHPVNDHYHQFAGSIEISAPQYKAERELWGKGGVLVHELAHAVHDKLCYDGLDNEVLLEVTHAFNFNTTR